MHKKDGIIPKLSASLLIAAVLLLFVLTGCGYNPEDAVYDVAANDKKFQEPVLKLLDRIETEQLVDADSIIEEFSDLYLQNQELLDNKAWKKVVDRLGVKFRYLGDRQVDKGIENYRRAAGYYMLADFARPGNTKIQTKNKLFSCWTGSDVDSMLALNRSILSDSITIAEASRMLLLVKQFYFTDSLHRKFGGLHLNSQLLAPLFRSGEKSDEFTDALSISDRAFLAHIGLTNIDLESPLAGFKSPAIDLVAYELVPVGMDQYRAEVYFVPREKIEAELDIAFWIDPGGEARPGGGASYFPFDFSPVTSAPNWETDHVAAESRFITYGGPIRTLSIGLYSHESGQISYLTVESTGGNLVRFEVGVETGN